MLEAVERSAEIMTKKRREADVEHDVGEADTEEDVKNIMRQVVELINDNKSIVKTVLAKASGRHTVSEIRFFLPLTYRFFTPGTIVAVYANESLPVFVGFSLDIFPDIMDVARKLGSHEVRLVLQDILRQKAVTAQVAWLAELVEKDEKFALLINALKSIQREIRAYRSEAYRSEGEAVKTKVKASLLLLKGMEHWNKEYWRRKADREEER